MTLALRCARFAVVHDSRLNLTFLHGNVRAYSSSSSGSSNPLGGTSEDAEKSQTPSKLKQSRDTMRENVRGYVFTRYFDMVKNYDKVLEKNFPSAVKVYRVFFDGVKDFYADMKRYIKISRIVNTSEKGLKALNRKELELYMQMPRDMVKIAPALIVSSLPMVGYAIFPLVFMYPRTFLTAHFWSLQQKAEFQTLTLQERLSFNRPVFRCLQAKLNSVESHMLHIELQSTLGLIGSGFHPTVDALLAVKDIFATPPYSLVALSGKHIKLLTQMHGLPGGWFKRHRLVEHAYIVHHMDLAIRREGDVHNMQPEAIKYACYIRGLNPTNLRNEEMIEWLRSWIRVSTSIKEDHITLFLHLPLFLAYNHPNNWQLIYGDSANQKSNIGNEILPKIPVLTVSPEEQIQMPDDKQTDQHIKEPINFAQRHAHAQVIEQHQSEGVNQQPRQQ